MTRPINRQHFIARRPLRTHYRPAECREVDCPHYIHGWQTVLPGNDPLCDWVRRKSGRHFREEHEESLVRFIFPPGQTCFVKDYGKGHWILEREEFGFYHRIGPALMPMEPNQWVDTFAEEMHRLKSG